jgi:hypothetical protein
MSRIKVKNDNKPPTQEEVNLLQKSEDKKQLTAFDGCVWII